MQLSVTFLTLALALGATAAPINVSRVDRRLLSLDTQTQDSPLLTAGLNTKSDGKDNVLDVGVNLCNDPLLGLIKCKTDSSTSVGTKDNSKSKPKPQPKGKGKGEPKKTQKPHHSAHKSSGNEVGGNAQGGNGGNASGGSSDCSTGNNLIGVNALNFNSCNGGNGGNASGGSAIGGHGGDSTIHRRQEDDDGESNKLNKENYDEVADDDEGVVITSRDLVGGSAKGGNGGNAKGGDSLDGLEAPKYGLLGDIDALNYDTKNGGHGGNASGGHAIGGHGGSTKASSGGKKNHHPINKGPSIHDESKQLEKGNFLVGRSDVEDADYQLDRRIDKREDTEESLQAVPWDSDADYDADHQFDKRSAVDLKEIVGQFDSRPYGNKDRREYTPDNDEVVSNNTKERRSLVDYVPDVKLLDALLDNQP